MTPGPIGGAYDLAVVGSGAAGLMAAARAASRSLRTVVLEKAAHLGGTSSIAAGTVWIPNNQYMAAAGQPDDPAIARAYLACQTHGHVVEGVVDTLVSEGTRMLAFAAQTCGLEFDPVMDYPDYRQDVPGAALGGRALQPRIFDARNLGALAEAIRADPLPPYTMREFKQWGSWARFPWDALEERRRQGLLARGAALVAPLIGACRDLGVALAVDAPVIDVNREQGRFRVEMVDGVLSATNVVLASGGFEWDGQLRTEHFGQRLQATCSPVGANTGDGHRIAARLGADTADMDQAWWAPMVAKTDAKCFGPASLIRVERQGPGTITVGADGRRFADESQNYNSFIRAAFEAESASPGSILPMALVFDHRFLQRYGFMRRRADETLPDGVSSAATVDELAILLGRPTRALVDAVEEFNRGARTGRDRFSRGADPYDVYAGDLTNPYPNPCLAPIEEPPFYGVPLVPGAFGTSGGVVTDRLSRAVSPDGTIIGGLFAVGNVSRHPVADSYPGAGATLGPALTTAFVAGSIVEARQA